MSYIVESLSKLCESLCFVQLHALIPPRMVHLTYLVSGASKICGNLYFTALFLKQLFCFCNIFLENHLYPNFTRNYAV